MNIKKVCRNCANYIYFYGDIRCALEKEPVDASVRWPYTCAGDWCKEFKEDIVKDEKVQKEG